MKRSSIIVFFIFLSHFVFGQGAKYQVLNGKIITDNSTKQGIIVMNTTNNAGTQSDQDGYFKIEAKPGDVLMFSAVQLIGRSVQLSQYDFEKEYFFIKLEEMVNQLDEVEIVDNRRINAKALGIIPQNQKEYTAAERKVYTATNGTDALINAISGRTKIMKKQVVIEGKERSLEILDLLYEDNFYINQLKIPAEYIKGFQYFAVEDAELARALKTKNKSLVTFLLSGLSLKFNAIRLYGK